MASSSSSSPSSQSWKYDVFLSFRGEDTRKTFVDHLYFALEQQGLYTYKDDKTLPRGESIGPALMKAIEESQIAVIIFSENYADSSWCLDELVCIMKCKDTKGQSVMPIFYHVDPSEVRKQIRIYGEAFAKHELENYKKVESWRKALVDASNISGWETKQVANGHEAKCIKEIVDTISHRLHLVTQSANENLVGIEARMQNLKSKLQIGSGGVRMIGIWGVGGGGKTTLASSVYSEIYLHFDGSCFVENIREESSKYGLAKMQEKILSNVLKQKEVEVPRVDEGRRMIKGKLCHRKVLIVLDDVNQLEQLRALAGSHDWFGEGSRIIITTRDEHVVLTTTPRVDLIHKISLLNDDEAMELFSKYAPQGHKRVEDYELLSEDVVFYAGGLPLALTTLGSSLCDKDINEWKSALARLKEIPNDDILETLKISFDGLTKLEKDLFLDIACFFRKKDKDKAMKTLDACGLHPVIGVKVLIQKALITISRNGEFDMHDLVQEMAHYIVRGEYPKNPEKHSRVWKTEDVLRICALDATMELDMIEAIRLDCNSHDISQLLPPIGANMKNLRWIDWRCDLASPFPTKFSPWKLCCLRLDGISQKQIWEGYKHLPNLKIMKLARLKNLIMTPDFGGLPNLEIFNLRKCPCLEEIDPSIGHLKRLVSVSIEDCRRLKMFPPITQLEKLDTLTFSFCPKLFTFTEIEQKNIKSLPHLHLDDSEDEVASYIESGTKKFVTWLTCFNNLGGDTEVEKPLEDPIDVECCLKESCLPHTRGLQFFHTGLTKLNLRHCHLRDEYIGSAVWELPNLQELNLKQNKFSRLNFSRLQLPRLKWLNVSECKSLVELSELPSSIAAVKADDCESLESFGDISNCKLLWKVSLFGKNKLCGDILLNSMLQGNAFENHFISAVVKHQMIPKEWFVDRLFTENTHTLHLPHDWNSNYCGFLIRVVTDMKSPRISIIIKQEVEEVGFRSEIWQEPDEYNEMTFIGYVSFHSLRNTTLLTSSHNIISFSIQNMFGCSAYKSYVGAELVPRKVKGDQAFATTDCSEFWDDERKHGNTFTIKRDSNTSINILWKPSHTLSPYGYPYPYMYPYPHPNGKYYYQGGFWIGDI
uniref:TIR domain-containing protein n=1 Tax=Lactuca sativa TaxID=4236 RepID=A0A9R1UR46_LACSA|nr:hypothetical protein LSAT_V11C800408960 [Lactuca sativa]